jgi:nicotinate-nucleotide pyrophosphorylase (carboxylating)
MIDDRLLAYLKEDAFDRDVTTALIPERDCTTEIVAKEDCVLAGVKEAREILESQRVAIVFSRQDGEDCRAGEVVMQLKGMNRAIFPVERTLLNVLGRMSSVATGCRRAEQLAMKHGVKSALTRKTMPGFREFDKRAARIGGSWPHRRDLSEMVLLKKQHLSYFNSVTEAVKKAKAVKGMKVEVEATTLAEALEAARAGADMVMLDNFSVVDAKKALKELRAFPAKIELSGGITFENLEEYAALKPDFISMGCLTKSASSRDFSLRLTR